MRQQNVLDEALDDYRAGRLDDAASCYRGILQTEPTHAEAVVGLADVLEAQGRGSDAITLLEESAARSPGSAPLRSRLADALHAQGDLPRAIEIYRQAIAIDPSRPGPWWGLGCALTSVMDHAGAAESFGRLISLQPENGLARHNLGRALFELGQVDAAIDAFRQAIDRLSPEMQDLPLGSIAVAIPGSTTASNRDVLDARRAWATRCMPPTPIDRSHMHPTSDLNRPLRVGYVSSFFAKRNWMKPVWGLIEHHDLDRFEVHMFSDGPEPDAQYGFRRNTRVAFHDVSDLSNAELAKSIQQQGIDLLVDLNAFSRPARLPLYGLRPAPVQAAWFNLFAPSGVSCFDYLIGDAHVIPVAEESDYTETIVRVPGSYLTFQVSYPVPDVAPAPSLKHGHLTFGCLAPQYKITTALIEAWSRILAQSPGTWLVLKNSVLGHSSARDFVRGIFARYSIPASRVDLDGPAEHFAFLERYADIDVALDTFPYNGGTTTAEAIWQGVPVLAFAGDRWAARISASILGEAGLGEFVAPDLDGLIARAVALARNPDSPSRLDALRRTMRDRLRAAPICDVRSFARNMEDAYLEMWRRLRERRGGDRA